MRSLVACLAVLGLMGACGAPGDTADGAGAPSAGEPDNNPNTFRADVDRERPYTGEWALARNQCGDEKNVWTIEPLRMAIVPSMRFCAFDRMYVSGGSDGAATWSASAKCLAGGQESHDFLFFRVKDNLREMRVTLNDSKPVELVRCPMKS